MQPNKSGGQTMNPEEEKSIDEEICRAHLNASGWELDGHMQSNIFQTHMFYLTDLRNDHTQLFSVNFADFNNFVPESAGFSASELSGIIAEMASEFPEKGTDFHHLNVFSHALASYFKLTRTYGLWLRKAKKETRLHAVFIITKTGAIRPFAMQSQNTVIDVQSYKNTVAQVIKADMQTNPDWYV